MTAQLQLLTRDAYGNWPWGGLEPHAYELIMADPPWSFELYSERGEEKSAQKQYKVMADDEIAALPVTLLCRPDCLLWLWCTGPKLESGLSVLRAWGFKYSTLGAWHKTTARGKTAFGTGYRLRSACEPFLIGTRGEPKNTHGVRSLVVGEAREHSRKPEAAFAAAEQLMPQAARCELFSRARRPRWDTWGDQATKFGEPATPVPPVASVASASQTTNQGEQTCVD